jgi:hypothetical protein
MTARAVSIRPIDERQPACRITPSWSGEIADTRISPETALPTQLVRQSGGCAHSYDMTAGHVYDRNAWGSFKAVVSDSHFREETAMARPLTYATEPDTPVSVAL